MFDGNYSGTHLFITNRNIRGQIYLLLLCLVLGTQWASGFETRPYNKERANEDGVFPAEAGNG